MAPCRLMMAPQLAPNSGRASMSSTVGRGGKSAGIVGRQMPSLTRAAISSVSRRTSEDE
jgi:hypothetical protein